MVGCASGWGRLRLCPGLSAGVSSRHPKTPRWALRGEVEGRGLRRACSPRLPGSPAPEPMLVSVWRVGPAHSMLLGIVMRPARMSGYRGFDMTRTNRGRDYAAPELISVPSWLAPARLLSVGIVLVTLALSAPPLEAAHWEVTVAAATQTVHQSDADRSETQEGEPLGFADRFVPDPDTSFEDGQWTWRVPTTEWVVGVVIGLLFAAWLLFGVLASVRRPTLIEPAASRGWFDRATAGSLAKDPLVWVYLLAASGFAGAVYSGSFGWLSGEASERLTGFAKWAPVAVTPALGLLGVLFGGGTKRWKVGAGDADALMKMLEQKSNAFLELVSVHVDDGVRREISRLAPKHEVGLIQRAMWIVCEKSVDQGRLQPAERDQFMSRLLEIQPGPDDRSTFLNRRAAVDLATELLGINELAKAMEEAEWRKMGERRESTAGPEGAERRSGSDRRVRSIWRPDDGLELDLAG